MRGDSSGKPAAARAASTIRRHPPTSDRARLFLALVRLQDFLAQPQCLGVTLDELVVSDKFDRLLQIQLPKGTRRMASSAVEARMLVSFFSRTTLTSRSLSLDFPQ